MTKLTKPLVILEGCDHQYKTTHANRILKTGFNLQYFRSNYQVGSDFASEKVNLDESLKHDWRILHDWLTQIGIHSDGILVDRGFVSSYVYSSIFRGKDLSKYFKSYVNIFKDITQHWFFLNEDPTQILTELKDKRYLDVDIMMKEVSYYMERQGCEVRRFYRRPGNKLITTDFLDLDTEINQKRLNTNYYNNRFCTFMEETDIYNPTIDIVSDFDGTIVKNEYPTNDKAEVIDSHIDYIRTLIKHHDSVRWTIVTGREQYIDEQYLNNIVNTIFTDKNVCILQIINDHNIGLSSRVLKQYVLPMIFTCLNKWQLVKKSFHYLEDRVDVIDSVISSNDKVDVSIITDKLYHVEFKNIEEFYVSNV